MDTGVKDKHRVGSGTTDGDVELPGDTPVFRKNLEKDTRVSERRVT